MFGHRDDVIRQDQKSNADVQLPDDAFDLLTNPPAQNSQTDSPAPASGTPQYNGGQSKNPPLLATSVDGFSAPAANLTDPMNYSVTPVSQPAYTADQPTYGTETETQQNDDSRHNPEVDPDHPEIAMEPIELSHNDEAHNEYLDTLTHSPSVDEVNELVNEELSAFVNSDQPAGSDANNQSDAAADTDSSAQNDNQDDQTSDTSDDDTANSPDDTSSDDTPKDEPSQDTPEEPDDSEKRVEDFAPVTDDLSELKQAALAELSPLVDRLSLEPEERFKTLMMLVQASDNQALLPQAHAAAKQITDEKTRAEALLDIVNEINYFTKETA